MQVRWLRWLWALAAFAPLVAISTPLFASELGLVWLACAMYLWPATWVANQFGFEPFSPVFVAISAVYCALVGALLAFALPRVFRLPPHLVKRRRAIVIACVIWVPIGAYAAYRVLDYKGLLATTMPCPGSLRILESHCAGIGAIKEHSLGGFIDTSLLARFQTRPGAIGAVAAAAQMLEVDPATVPDSVWSQSPYWWAPVRNSRTRVYTTPRFPFDDRGGDGDYYLFIEDGEANQVFAIVKYNF